MEEATEFEEPDVMVAGSELEKVVIVDKVLQMVVADIVVFVEFPVATQRNFSELESKRSTPSIRPSSQTADVMLFHSLNSSSVVKI